MFDSHKISRDFPNSTAFLTGIFERVNGVWQFVAIGDGSYFDEDELLGKFN